VVRQSRDGVEASKKLQRCGPTWLTLDLQMPNMDGLTVLDQFSKTTNSGSLCSVVTRRARRPRWTPSNAAPVDYVAKPDKVTGKNAGIAEN